MAANTQLNPFSTKTVLLVEDVEAMRELMAALLDDIGFAHVLECDNGTDALEMLADPNWSIDLIVCDLEMPEMDGITFTRKLRAHPQTGLRNIPVVVVTGHTEAKVLRLAVAAGIHGYLVKPVSRTSLEKRVRHALKGQPIDPALFDKRQHESASPVPPPEVIEGKKT